MPEDQVLYGQLQNIYKALNIKYYNKIKYLALYIKLILKYITIHSN